MDAVIPHETVLLNLTEFPLQFAVQAQRFTIPSLNSRGEHLVNSSEILKISRRLESASWPIKVLNDEKFSGLKLEGRHFLDYVLIAFKFRRIEYEKYILVAEGVKEKKGVDMFLRMGRGFGSLLCRNWIWMRRNFEVIAKAPPEYARTMSQMSENHESANNNKKKRNTTTGDTTLTGSILVREGRVSRISGQHMDDRESYHHPDSTHSSSMDSFDYIFLFLLALLLVSFLKVQL